jgi:hypothetical protein
MNKFYTIKITGGTSPGPYTIYYYNNGPIASLYPAQVPALASGITLTQLTGTTGVSVTVPENITSLWLYNQYCFSGITLIPTTIITYQPFCLTFAPHGSRVVRIQFIYAGTNTVNNTPYWADQLNPNTTIKWNGFQWVLTGYQQFNPMPITIFSTYSIFANPPIGGWQSTGVDPDQFDIIPSLDDCESPEPEELPRQSYPVSINQPTCLCDGSILFNPNLDNPPFTYSINNGVTYSVSPIFSNLCSGIYNLSILDSLNENYVQTITLDEPTISTTYTLLLNTIPSTQINNPTTISKTYETTIRVTPELPDGTTIYFDLVHNNSFYSGPLSGSSILTTGTLVYKNEISVPLSSSVSGNSTSINTAPGCQSTTIYQYNTTESWNTLELTNTDNITVSTSTRTDKTTLGSCVVGYSNDSYSIANARIVGCDCCSILINT